MSILTAKRNKPGAPRSKKKRKVSSRRPRKSKTKKRRKPRRNPKKRRPKRKNRKKRGPKKKRLKKRNPKIRSRKTNQSPRKAMRAREVRSETPSSEFSRRDSDDDILRCAPQQRANHRRHRLRHHARKSLYSSG